MTPYGGVFDLVAAEKKLEDIEKDLARPGAWDQPELLTPLLQEKSRLSFKVKDWRGLLKSREDLDEWLYLAEEEETEEVLESLDQQMKDLAGRLEMTEIGLMLSEPQDKADAILEIHPGAGGTESQDWAEMLLRMYRRWAERHEYSQEILDYQPGDEAGLKSVMLRISGPHAYGLLKSEAGIHRLIRISPFDSSGRRHTSFASVDVYPDIAKEIKIEIKDDELRIDTFRSSGPGGQSVNTTSSAVRITHLPTGLSVQCQNEKSQIRNRETALQVLKARLYEAELRKMEQERQDQYDNKAAIGFGSQIRTYTLQPYRLVKDHRTNSEESDVDAVLDGKVDNLIRDYLLERHARKNK